jgi:hypothetical protein
MGKKVKSALNVATFGLSGAAEKLAIDPITSALGIGSGAAAAAGSTQVTPDTSPTAVSEGTLAAREAQRKRQLAAAGLSGTNLTGASGLSGAANTATKTLLGS